MFCINCSHSSTQVVNSRPGKKSPSVWRRRVCPQCGTTFTTYEKPALTENRPVLLPGGDQISFNIGCLIQSIASSFSHDSQKARYDSLALAETVASKLSVASEKLTRELIATTTYDTLKHYDELAALQYAAKHHLITKVSRRGRPSFS